MRAATLVGQLMLFEMRRCSVEYRGAPVTICGLLEWRPETELNVWDRRAV